MTTRELLAVATRAIVRLLGERGSCILFDGRPRVAISTYAPEACGWAVDVEKYPEIKAAIDARSIVTVEDTRSDPLLSRVRASLPPGVGAVAVVPLVIRDECVGVLVAQSSHARSITPQNVATASLLGKLTARLLPLDSIERQRASFPARTEAAPSPSAGKRTVLIIDDDADNAGNVADILVMAGFSTLWADDGEAGVQLARERRPDLILLDVNMPKLDGYCAARILGEDVLTRETPIVFLSGAPDLLTRVRDFRVQGLDFLQKPFRRQELVTRVERSFDQAELRRRARSEANLDELTGLGNLRTLRERLAVEAAHWKRHETPVAIVTVDVDKLKRINDTLGHAAGSLALSAIGEVLRSDVRETDLAVRYGGDEFVVVLSHTGIADAVRFAERVLEHVRALRCNGVGVSVSIGVASLEGNEPIAIETILQRSDAAAYEAKRSGGNRVCVFEHEGARAHAR